MGCCDNLSKNAGAVTFKGDPLTLVGDMPELGASMPDGGALVTNDLGESRLAEFGGKRILLATVPSLDTGVCDMEARKFNEKTAAASNAAGIVVSMDLPFAQGRWCEDKGVGTLTTLSAYRNPCFGSAWGVFVEELHLLARAVFVIDESGVVVYRELVKEIAEEPDYDAALSALQA
jgi:thioredoxin-dependent peroxiredoxin